MGIERAPKGGKLEYVVFDKGVEWLLSRNYCYEITPHTPERS